MKYLGTILLFGWLLFFDYFYEYFIVFLNSMINSITFLNWKIHAKYLFIEKSVGVINQIENFELTSFIWIVLEYLRSSEPGFMGQIKINNYTHINQFFFLSSLSQCISKNIIWPKLKIYGLVSIRKLLARNLLCQSNRRC